MNSVEEDEFDIQQGLQSVWALPPRYVHQYLPLPSCCESCCQEWKEGKCDLLPHLLPFLCSSSRVCINHWRQAGRKIITSANNGCSSHFMVIYTISMIIFLSGAEFMSRFGYFLFTNINCQLFTYTLYGNRILQVIR